MGWTLDSSFFTPITSSMAHKGFALAPVKRFWSVLARILNPAHEQNCACGLVIQEVDEGTGRVDR
jgi:hypothetical protein